MIWRFSDPDTIASFVVFYNGGEPFEEKRELRLSEAFVNREEDSELELRVQVLNIKGFNEELKGQCCILGEYMQYVNKVRAYREQCL